MFLLVPVFVLVLVAAAPGKKPKTFKAKTIVEVEEYMPRTPGTAQTFTAEGGVSASRPACRVGRRVEVHQINGIVDTVVAVTTTVKQPGNPAEGGWSATWTTPPNGFSFFVEVSPRKIPKKHTLCKIGSSPPVTFPG